MKKYYTYAYLREDGTPYYIGKGSGNRINSHHRKHLGLPPVERRIYLKTNLTEEEAFNHERYMVALYGRKDNNTGILINLTDGGDNPPLNNMGGWNKGMTMNFSPERGKKIGASLKNYVKTEEHKKNISDTMKGRTPWNKGKSRFANEEERLAHKREYSRLRSQRIRDEKKRV